MFSAGHAAEDLEDHPQVAVGGEVRDIDPAERVAEHQGGSPLLLHRRRLVEARRGDGDVVDTFALLSEEPREDALVVARPSAAPDRGPSSKAPGQGDPGVAGAID